MNKLIRSNAVILPVLALTIPIVALPILPEVSQGISNSVLPLNIRQVGLPHINLSPASTTTLNIAGLLQPALTNDLTGNLSGDVPANLVSAIAAINPLVAFIASVLEAAVENVLYFPRGFYYGNPLIPFSGIIPGVLASAAGPPAVIPPLDGQLLNALTNLAGLPTAVTPLEGLLPSVLAGLPAAPRLSIPTPAPIGVPVSKGFTQ